MLTDSENTVLVNIDENIAFVAAGLRARYTLKTPDSIQMATSSLLCDYFLTNDKRLKIKGNEQIILLDDLI